VTGLEQQWHPRMAKRRTNTWSRLTPGSSSPTRIASNSQGEARMATHGHLGDELSRRRVVFRGGLYVRGLNTAARLWCEAEVDSAPAKALRSSESWRRLIGAITALRPIVHAINRQPRDTIEERAAPPYLVRLPCGRCFGHPIPVWFARLRMCPTSASGNATPPSSRTASVRKRGESCCLR
jgi:hypothetical protein